jgi:hypothetical protein
MKLAPRGAQYVLVFARIVFPSSPFPKTAVLASGAAFVLLGDYDQSGREVTRDTMPIRQLGLEVDANLIS